MKVYQRKIHIKDDEEWTEPACRASRAVYVKPISEWVKLAPSVQCQRCRELKADSIEFELYGRAKAFEDFPRFMVVYL